MANLYNLRKLGSMSIPEIQKRLGYFTFMVVRHPFDRVLSAYNDKMVKTTDNWYRHAVGKRIQKELNKNATEDQLRTGKGVTFRQFVQYLNKYKNYDYHWASIQSVCHPCINRIDYIINLEASTDDREYIIRKKLSGYGARSHGIHHTLGNGAQAQKQLHLYDTLSQNQFDQLWNHYKVDFHMFGYSLEKKNHKLFAQCGTDEYGEKCC